MFDDIVAVMCSVLFEAGIHYRVELELYHTGDYSWDGVQAEERYPQPIEYEEANHHAQYCRAIRYDSICNATSGLASIRSCNQDTDEIYQASDDHNN